jgi:sugar lactone lactonase YvrE
MSLARTLPAIGFLLLAAGGSAVAQQFVISTVAGGAPPTAATGTSASVGGLAGVAADSQGNVYFTALNCVFRLAGSGNLTVVAGNSRPGFSGDNGPATSAQLNNPWGVALDTAGNLYIGDSGNNRVRKVSSAGVITTIAGNGNGIYSGEGGPAAAAGLSVYGVAVDSVGNVYVADTGNEAIRKVSSAGVITTAAGIGLAGYGGDGGLAINAELNNPLGVAVDGAGDLYIADTSNSVIREVSSGVIATVAGTGNFGYSGDGGPSASANLSAPSSVAVDSSGNIYIDDAGNGAIRKVSAGTIATVAGNGLLGYSGDGGSATNATLGLSVGVAVDQSGNLYIADAENVRVRKISSGGVITTIAGDGLFSYGGDSGQAVSAQLGTPHGTAVDSSGNLYLADTANNRVRKVSPSGIITTVAGTGALGHSGDGGAATSATLSGPQGVAIDNAGNLYIADTGNDAIRKVSASGVISTIAGANGNSNTGDGGPATSAALSGPTAVLPDGLGNLYIADSGSAKIRVISSSGVISTFAGSVLRGYAGDGGPATSAFLNNPTGMALDSVGNLYIADSGNSAIREVTTNGNISTIAGNGSAGYSGDGGPATSAEFNFLSGVAVDGAGNIYVTDTLNHRVRKISGGTVTTVAGTAQAAYSGDGGPAATASFVSPWGIAIFGSDIYVSDSGDAVRLLVPAPNSGDRHCAQCAR